MRRLAVLVALVALGTGADSVGRQVAGAAPPAARWAPGSDWSGFGPGRCGERTPAASFSVPTGGGNAWSAGEGRPAAQYLTRLTARVTRGEPSMDGWATLTEYVGGELAASVTVESTRVGSHWQWRWGTVDLVHGARSGGVPLDGTTVRSTNFLAFNTVEGGARNPIRFAVSCSDRSAPVGSFDLLPTTSVEETQLQPANLRLTSVGKRVAPTVGRVFPVRFSLTNSGGLPARQVRVGVNVLQGKVQPLGRRSVRFATVHGSVTGVFDFVSLASGPVRLEVTANSSNANQPAVRLLGTAASPATTPGGGIPWRLVSACVAALALATAAVLLVRRRPLWSREP